MSKKKKKKEESERIMFNGRTFTWHFEKKECMANSIKAQKSVINLF